MNQISIKYNNQYNNTAADFLKMESAVCFFSHVERAENDRENTLKAAEKICMCFATHIETICFNFSYSRLFSDTDCSLNF